MLIFTKNDFFNEIMKATLKVTKFMGAAFLRTGIITFYLTEDFISVVVLSRPVSLSGFTPKRNLKN
jgi:hypothetical protein